MENYFFRTRFIDRRVHVTGLFQLAKDSTYTNTVREKEMLEVLRSLSQLVCFNEEQN